MTTDERLDLLLVQVAGMQDSITTIYQQMKFVQTEIISLKREMHHELSNIKQDICKISTNMATKRNLNQSEKRTIARISTSEELVLEEISRVHEQLEVHMKSNSIHIS